MPEHARRLTAAPFDQFEEGDRVADWGGDDLFTRTPRPRRRALALVEPPEDRRAPAAVEQRSGQRDRRRTPHPAEQALRERVGVSMVEPPSGSVLGPATAPAPSPVPVPVPVPEPEPVPERAYRWDESGALIALDPAGRRTSVITGHPEGAPRPLPIVRAERRRPAWTPAEWIWARPERIVGWAFALGLILILIAITTADATTP